MDTPDDERTPRERLPDSLLEALDELEFSQLRATHEYVENRLEATRPPIEDQIRDEADGDVLEIEDEGVYTFVRMRLPSPDESADSSGPVSLYHVTRERHPDGEETLHWSFLGDVAE